jgi:hypothetical protein
MKFRKKPVVVEAFQMTALARRDNKDWPGWLHIAWQKDRNEAGSVYPCNDFICINTLEGEHQVTPNDWIIQGIQGELYPCKPDIFAATYDDISGEPRLQYPPGVRGLKA